MGEWGEGAIWLMARWRVVRSVTDLVTLMLIVVAVEAEQLPVAAVQGIVVMVMVLVMDRKLGQLLPVKFTSAVGTNPGEEFQRARSVGLLVVGVCHASLQEKG